MRLVLIKGLLRLNLISESGVRCPVSGVRCPECSPRVLHYDARCRIGVQIGVQKQLENKSLSGLLMYEIRAVHFHCESGRPPESAKN